MDSSRLPPELLCFIFSHLDIWTRIIVSHVCSNWRYVTLNDPSLWTSLTTESANPSPEGTAAARLRLSVEALETLLPRSAMLPVSIGLVHFTGSNFLEMSTLVCRHLQHMQRLCATLLDHCVYHDVLKMFTSATAPVLTTLELTVPNPPWTIMLPSQLFLGTAPLLRNLTLGGIHIPSSCGALASVTNATLSVGAEPSRLPICLTDVMPRLNDLIMEIKDNPIYTLGAEHAVDSLTLLPRYSGDDLRANLDVLHHAQVFFMSATFATVDSVCDILQGLGIPIVSLEAKHNPVEARYNPDFDEETLAVEFRAEADRRVRRFTYLSRERLAVVLWFSNTLAGMMYWSNGVRSTQHEPAR